MERRHAGTIAEPNTGNEQGADDAAAVHQLLARHPELKANDPGSDFHSPLIPRFAVPAMLDVLVEPGVDLNVKSEWWAPGFGLLDCGSGIISLCHWGHFWEEVRFPLPMTQSGGQETFPFRAW